MGWWTSKTSEIKKTCIKGTDKLVQSFGVWLLFSSGKSYTTTKMVYLFRDMNYVVSTYIKWVDNDNKPFYQNVHKN